MSGANPCGRTVSALEQGGLVKAAANLAAVSGPGNKPAWEQYAREAFLALAAQVPRNANEPSSVFSNTSRRTQSPGGRQKSRTAPWCFRRSRQKKRCILADAAQVHLCRQPQSTGNRMPEHNVPIEI